jgi:hypothetical protein
MELPSTVRPCVLLRAAAGPDAATTARLTKFFSGTSRTPELMATLAHSMAAQAIAYVEGFEARCVALNNVTLAPLRSLNATKASVIAMLSTTKSLVAGVTNHLTHTVAKESVMHHDGLAAELLALWG